MADEIINNHQDLKENLVVSENNFVKETKVLDFVNGKKEIPIEEGGKVIENSAKNNIKQEESSLSQPNGANDEKEISEDLTESSLKQKDSSLLQPVTDSVTTNGVSSTLDEEEEEEEVICDVYSNKFDGRTSQIPDFAVVYSFFDLFGAYLDLPRVTISDLEQSIDSTKSLGKKGDDLSILETLHIKLFRRLHKSNRYGTLANCQVDRLYKTLLKFTIMLDLNCAWDLEQFGYHILSSAQKLLILKNLCEVQFDENIKFRTAVQEAHKSDQGASLRLSPYGYEQEGLNVWLHEDQEFNIRVYAGEEDDVSGDTWKVRAGSIEDLESYISQLKLQTEINPKDFAVEKIKERRLARQEEREIKRKEREQKQKEEEELKQKKNKGRNRRSKAKKVEVKVESDVESDEDDGCARCYENKQCDLVVLCDGCDAAYHTLCLRPIMLSIPEGDWFCPFCMQLKLIEKLQSKYSELRKKILAKERQSKRLDFYGIRAANILQQEATDNGLGRRRAAKRVDYNFGEYERMMSDAVKTYKKDDSMKTRTDDSDSNKKESRRSKRGRMQKKLTNLSSDDGENCSSGTDYELSETDSDYRRRNNDMRGFLVDNDVDEIEERHRSKYLRRSKRNRQKRNKSRRRSSQSDDDDDVDDDESSGHNMSDSSDGFGPRRSKRRRAVTTYNETYSDGEDESNELVRKLDAGDDGEWKDAGAEELVEEDEFESHGEDGEEPDNRLSQSKKTVGAKSKRKKRHVIESDDDDDDDDDEDDDVIYQDKSEEEFEEECEDDEKDDLESSNDDIKKDDIQTSTEHSPTTTIEPDLIEPLRTDMSCTLEKPSELPKATIKDVPIHNRYENDPIQRNEDTLASKSETSVNQITTETSVSHIQSTVITSNSPSNLQHPLPQRPFPVPNTRFGETEFDNSRQIAANMQHTSLPWDGAPNRYANDSKHRYQDTLAIKSGTSVRQITTETSVSRIQSAVITSNSASNLQHPLPRRPVPVSNTRFGGTELDYSKQIAASKQHTSLPWAGAQVTHSIAETLHLPPNASRQFTPGHATQYSGARHPYLSSHIPHSFPEQPSSPITPTNSQTFNIPQNLPMRPMRPRPTYSHRMANPSANRFPPYIQHQQSQHQWNEKNYQPNPYVHYPQSVPANRFYSENQSWQHQEHRSPIADYSRPAQHNNLQSSLSNYELEHKKTQKRHLKDQVKLMRETKKTQKQVDKDHTRYSATSLHPPSSQPSAKGIGYFKNMVISSDGLQRTNTEKPFQNFDHTRI